jgi:N-methylhydantoinase A/oxoprolinase/acetone carboxylase beta subunit
LNNGLRIGIDIGGTFTDFVVYDPLHQSIETFKLLSTPHDPAEVVIDGIKKIFGSLRTSEVSSDPYPASHIIHGSTVATNALLERKGARTALITTRGFKDVLQIGRQNRPELYDLFADPLPPLVPEELRFELDERVDHQGQVLEALKLDQVDALIPILRRQEVVSVAVCFLFSFLHPAHEHIVTDRLRQAGFLVSSSSEILPEYRESERMSTTAVNAYVSPILDGYLSHLESVLQADGEGLRLHVMQSNGGMISPGEARRNGVYCILSGPAGGVVGAQYISQMAFADMEDRLEMGLPSPKDGRVRVITFDMGGTSTDVSLIDGAPQVTTEAEVGGCPIRIPVLDIHTIGAGGGSIAYVDAGGALRVGPQSAGADPGPACYGKGDLPTVTDANLVLGRLAPDYFLGGQMLLEMERALDALARLGENLGLSAVEAALGVVDIANAHMERALRVISVVRGHDPRTFTLLSFGGAGGLHAVELAANLGIPSVLVPPLASTLSAFGMLAASVVKDYTQTVMLPGDTVHSKLDDLLAPLVKRGKSDVGREGIETSDIQVERFLDMRYRGQSYELTVPFTPDVASDFHGMHESVYGYSRPDAAIEIVNLRTRAVGYVKPPPQLPGPLSDRDPGSAFIEDRAVVFSVEAEQVPFYRAEALQRGNHIPGPAVIVRADTTILINPHYHADVDAFGNLLITIEHP